MLVSPFDKRLPERLTSINIPVDQVTVPGYAEMMAEPQFAVVPQQAIQEITSWLYRDPSHPIIPMLDQSGFQRTGREVRLQSPLTEEQVRSLKVGDVVLVSGRMFTGRDAVHSYLMKHEPPVDLRGSVLYHCGPVVVKEGDGWKVTAAGPTTSIREEPYQAEIIKRYGVRAVIGKGGMGAKTLGLGYAVAVADLLLAPFTARAVADLVVEGQRSPLLDLVRPSREGL